MFIVVTFFFGGIPSSSEVFLDWCLTDYIMHRWRSRDSTTDDGASYDPTHHPYDPTHNPYDPTHHPYDATHDAYNPNHPHHPTHHQNHPHHPQANCWPNDDSETGYHHQENDHPARFDHYAQSSFYTLRGAVPGGR